MEKLYIASLKHTKPSDHYITFWRAESAGYAWPLDWAGLYSYYAVLGSCDYFNNGHSTVAVNKSVVDKLGVKPAPYTVDGNAGPVVPNTRENWEHILAGAPIEPLEKPCLPIKRGK